MARSNGFADLNLTIPKTISRSMSVSEQLHTYLPWPNINPNLSSVNCCWIRGRVGPQFLRGWHRSHFFCVYCTIHQCFCRCKFFSAQSSSQVKDTQEEYKGLSGVIQTSKNLLNKYNRREVTDRLLIFFGLVLFFSTVLYILKKRLPIFGG